MKELHIWLGKPKVKNSIDNLQDTQKAINNNIAEIHTTQPHVCNADNLEKGYHIFAHMLDGDIVEIKLGKIRNCNKEIRREHNLERMLLAGSFGMAQTVNEQAIKQKHDYIRKH